MTSLPRALDPNDPEPERARSLRDWLDFQWHLALHPVIGAELLQDEGGPRAALAASPRRRSPPGDPATAVATLRARGVRAVPLGSPAYPAGLARLRDPALLLLVRGDVEVLAARCVAIVGSRAATAYGLNTARRLAEDLARAGLVVVSGLARGIDAAAHRGALEAGGRTIAVLAGGPDRVYPAQHRGLANEVAARGAVVSELPPGTAPQRAFFPMRNRLISGLSEAVVIVEARERSGSLITAGHAANQGVDVFAVPGPVTAATSAGPNRLLRDGAYIALGADDVLRELGVAPVPPGGPAEQGAPVSEGQRGLLALLAREPGTRDELSRRLTRRPEQLALDLLELELAGRIVREADGRWHCQTPPAGRR
ncbi:MAG: DNA-processing protein DprA [Myxococcota bacterium]